MTNKPFASIYIEVANKHVVRESGFDRMPYLVPRWSACRGNVRSGSGDAGASRHQGCQRDVTNTARSSGMVLAIGPPLMVPSNSVEGPIRTSPGSILYYRSGTREVPQPLVSGANPAVGQALLEKQEQRIEEAFFLDKLTLPMNDRMTNVTEIIERRQQGKGSCLPPPSFLGCIPNG